MHGYIAFEELILIPVENTHFNEDVGRLNFGTNSFVAA